MQCLERNRRDTLLGMFDSCLSGRSFAIEDRQVKFRLLRRDDLDLWIDFVNGCSRESLWFRFMVPFRATPEKARRFCDLDPKRELAIVAETSEEGCRKAIGIARLIKLSCGRKAEFAVIVSDPWQKMTLGYTLSEMSVGLVKQWGVNAVFSETMMENRAMIRILKRCRFRVEERNGNMFTMSLPLV